MRVFLSCLCGLVFLAPPPAGAQTKGATPRAAARKGHRSAPPAALPDPQLERAIRARFSASKISADHFEVHVQGGVATIEGSTDVIQHKGVATRLAKACGAAAVANHVRISQAAREKAAANLAKGRRRAQLKRGEARSEGSSIR